MILKFIFQDFAARKDWKNLLFFGRECWLWRTIPSCSKHVPYGPIKVKRWYTILWQGVADIQHYPHCIKTRDLPGINHLSWFKCSFIRRFLFQITDKPHDYLNNCPSKPWRSVPRCSKYIQYSNIYIYTHWHASSTIHCFYLQISI